MGTRGQLPHSGESCGRRRGRGGDCEMREAGVQAHRGIGTGPWSQPQSCGVASSRGARSGLRGGSRPLSVPTEICLPLGSEVPTPQS